MNDPNLQETASLGSSPADRASQNPAQTLAHRWGPLELIEKVGEGAFGETFRARDPRLDREVALKVLRPEMSRDAASSALVVREGAMLARVRHPNVAIVHGAELIDARVGVWMEFVRGRTLEQMLKEEGPIAAREATGIGIDLCSALRAVHRAGIIHRDIKAANVMQEEGGRIVLMDFGAGLDLQKGASDERAPAGTPLYMAPEILRYEAATERSDVYSLGVLLYHLVTGGYPLTAGSLRELHEAHKQRRIAASSHEPARPTAEWKALGRAREDLPEQFVRVVDRCLSVEPEQRYESVVAVEGALIGAVADLTAYRKARIAEWSQPRYRLDKEFVALTLLIDQGEESSAGRWRAQPERYADLRELLAAVDDPALVLLGPPGSGKSTLLRRLELDVAEAALAAADADDRVTFFIQLNHYRPARPGEPLPEPRSWLSDRWQARFPDLPPLQSLLDQGRVTLLLDALNEMPTGLFEAVLRWKEFLLQLVAERPGNRVVFSCRTLDYSAPLSTPALRVPQVVIGRMNDIQVEQFLMKHRPERGAAIWSYLKATPQLEVMRAPYLLTVLLDQIGEVNEIPKGRAGLFTGFVRQALRREMERDNPLFAPDGLMSERDARRITQWRWKTPWELPERGALVPKLTELAFAMQAQSEGGGASQVRIDYDAALDLLDTDRDKDIVKAGVALAVLDDDPVNDEVLFVHQLIQEYFAGRRLAVSPAPERVRAVWQADQIDPPLKEVLRSLPVSERLPPLATTGWEETMLMAGAMTSSPDDFVRDLMPANLVLAGRCAELTEVNGRMAPALIGELRQALAARVQARDADLRARIAAGLALGALGDSRFERRRGPHGDYLLPPLVAIPGGRYPIGEDAPIGFPGGGEWTDHMPRHELEIAPFGIGRFAVTNAEWALFMASGGYDDERWWDTPAALRWQRGEGTADANISQVRLWVERFRKFPELLEEKLATGHHTQKDHDAWKARAALTEADSEASLRKQYPGGKLRAPLFWRQEEANNPAQPVVAVCWFEARAYANWMAAQTGMPFRLPTEVEWEAAARGRGGRIYSYGDQFDVLRGNTVETRIRRSTPVGAFPDGDTPEGVADLTGNVAEWTGSQFGNGSPESEVIFGYPYRSSDGREDPAAGPDRSRVLRGGSWIMTSAHARAACRYSHLPGFRYFEVGFRLVAGK